MFSDSGAFVSGNKSVLQLPWQPDESFQNQEKRDHRSPFHALAPLPSSTRTRTTSEKDS